MNREHPFFKQTELMLRLLPLVAKEKCFALKGGTAINFFIRNMPRLSVDIDLTYIPIQTREESLSNISHALKRITADIKSFYRGSVVQEKIVQNRTAKIFVRDPQGTQVTIEPNEVIRGSVYPIEEMKLSPAAEKTFSMSAKMQVLSLEDLYGGKICAALDRQHPRDLFDIKILLENEGITEKIRKSFLIYLAGHDRPMSELLNPTFKDIKLSYENEFFGMTSVPILYEELLISRKECLSSIIENLTLKEREFLLSIKLGEPKWDLLELKNLEVLPALQWKLLNIKKMSPQKHKLSVNKLKDVLKL